MVRGQLPRVLHVGKALPGLAGLEVSSGAGLIDLERTRSQLDKLRVSRDRAVVVTLVLVGNGAQTVDEIDHARFLASGRFGRRSCRIRREADPDDLRIIS